MPELFKTWFLRPSQNGRVQLFRSLFVGAAASVTDMAVLAALFTGLGQNALLSAALGFIAGLLVNFVLTRLWVFTGSRLSGAAEFIAFSVISVIGLGLTMLIVWVFETPVAAARPLGAWLSAEGYVFAGKLAAIAAVFAWNFLMRKYVVYRK
ncbi:MAG: GtrA family protein [Oscillospiraceae bacterium]|nr:GtrA family protein [Oscillospiraceae bacterium]